MKLIFVLELTMVNMWMEYSLLWEWEPCACMSLIEPKLSYITKLNDTWIQIMDYTIVSSMYTTTTKNKTVFLTLTQSITCTQPSILEEWTHNDIWKGGRGGHKAYLILGSYILYYFTFYLFGHRTPKNKCRMHISLLFATSRLCTLVDPWIMSKAFKLCSTEPTWEWRIT